MTDTREFPAEFPADPERDAAALRWTIGVIGPSALALALLNAAAIADWTNGLPVAPSTAKVMTAAEAWNAGTGELGLDAPRAGLHRAWQRAQAMQWPTAREAES